MNPVSKAVLAIVPVSKTNGASATGAIDTRGFDFATIDVILSAADGTATKPGTLKISEGDTTSSVTAVGVLEGGGSTGFTIANGNTSGSVVLKANVALKNRKRYLVVEVSPSTTQIVCCVANLHKQYASPGPDASTTFSGSDVVVST